MIEGVIHHCTEMEVDRQYVDSHGQSTIAFAFCRLLGFRLLPRLKAIHSQTLYRPETGNAGAHANLQLILSKPIDWELVRQQYDQMIKYTTALRLGTAETEAILRRFTKKNVQHPTYKAFAELGKATLAGQVHTPRLRRPDPADLGARESVRSIRPRHEYAIGVDVTQMAPGDTTVNGMDAPTFNVISCAKVEASSNHLNQQERPR